MIRRAGFTLLETAIVLAITAIAALLVVPAWPLARQSPTNGDNAPGDALVALLAQARHQAVSAQQTVWVRMDAAQHVLRMDTSGVHGRGTWRDTVLPLGPNEMLVTADTSSLIVFRPTGATQSRPMALRHASGWMTLTLDPWSGEAHREPR